MKYKFKRKLKHIIINYSPVILPVKYGNFLLTIEIVSLDTFRNLICVNLGIPRLIINELSPITQIRRVDKTLLEKLGNIKYCNTLNNLT